MEFEMKLREKLNVANKMYSKAIEIEREVHAMVQSEIWKYDTEQVYEIDQIVDYFNHVMNDEVELAEMLIMRDVLDAKINALTKR